jgi:hypothetical protein
MTYILKLQSFLLHFLSYNYNMHKAVTSIIVIFFIIIFCDLNLEFAAPHTTETNNLII